MVKILTRTLLCTVLLMACAAMQAKDRSQCFDNGWKFMLGDPQGAEQAAFDDSQWRALDLPHDWSIEPEAAAKQGENVNIFTRKAPGGRDTGWTYGGTGWYRKAFALSAEELKGVVWLYFEGVYYDAEVWVNGTKVGENHYGYSSFRLDITEACKPAGEQNIVAVRVKNEGKNSRWYAGSGIYRHVWLQTMPTVHLDEWGIFANTIYMGTDKATVRCSANVVNDTKKGQKATVTAEFLDPNGQKLLGGTQKATIGGGAYQAVNFSFSLAQYEAWSPENPKIYTLRLTCRNAKTGEEDVTTTKVGIRIVSADAQHGLLLNGKPVLLRGGCIHHDNGLLGAAAFNRAEDRKLQLMKDNGFNAVRCSHNIPSVHFLDACDSIGMLVIDEAFDQWLEAKNPDDYHRLFQQQGKKDMQVMVRRDRNHPSVIMWSIGNEIPGRCTPEGKEAAAMLRETIRQLDTNRPITAGICEWDSHPSDWDNQMQNAFVSLDVAGLNYIGHQYENTHKNLPNLPIMATESFPMVLGEYWNMVEENTYIIGDFVWTAWDYVGEAGCGNAGQGNTYGHNGIQWPWFNAWCGDLDLIGQKKPQSYYRDVVWRQKPITMAVSRPLSDVRISPWGWPLEAQTWTFNDLSEKDSLRVNVYSRSPIVRLYLNDQFVGQAETNKTFTATFNVPYKPGTLRAETANGEQFTLTTAGKPVALRLVADRTSLQADGTDLAYVTIELVDAAGRVVSDSDRKVNISLGGAGTLLACGNASPTDMESFRNNSPRLFEGRAQAIVKSLREGGNITLSVSSDGLATQTINISSRK